MPRLSTAVIRGLLIVVVTAAVARTVAWDRLGEQLHLGFVLGILAAQPLGWATAAVQSWRHALLITDPPPRFLPVFAAFLLASGLNHLMPARTGELVKASYLHAHLGIPLGVGVAAVMVERVLDVLLLAMMALAGMGLLALETRYAWVAGAMIVGILAGAALLMPRLGRAERTLDRWLERRQWPLIAAIVLPMLRHLDSHLSQRRLLAVTALTLGAWLLVGGLYAVFLDLAGDRPVTVANCALLVITTSVGIAIPILPGGLLTFEGAAVLTLTGAGYGFDAAVLLAIGLRLCIVVTIVPIAMMILAANGTGLGALWRMRQSGDAAVAAADQNLRRAKPTP